MPRVPTESEDSMCAAWSEGYSHHTIHLGRSTCKLPLGDSGKTMLWSQIPRAKAGYRKEHSARQAIRNCILVIRLLVSSTLIRTRMLIELQSYGMCSAWKEDFSTQAFVIVNV